MVSPRWTSLRRVISALKLPPRSRAIISDQPMESMGDQGSGAGARSSQNSGGSGDERVVRYAFTPRAYAASCTRVSGSRLAKIASAERRMPMVRRKRSVSRPGAPTSSESRPLAMRRFISICQSRSCAWTKPSAAVASRSVSAKMCGTPSASRTTCTGFWNPGSVIVPATCGSTERTYQSPRPSTPATSSSTRAVTHLTMVFTMRMGEDPVDGGGVDHPRRDGAS